MKPAMITVMALLLTAAAFCADARTLLAQGEGSASRAQAAAALQLQDATELLQDDTSRQAVQRTLQDVQAHGLSAQQQQLRAAAPARDETARRALQQQGPSNTSDTVASLAAPQLKMVIWVVDMCGKGGGPSTTAEAVRTLMLGGGNPGTRNFADYISTCSYGSTQLDTSSLLVINLQLPCSGVSARTNAPWTVTSCQGDSLLGWFDYAEQRAAASGIDLTDYGHRVMVLPRNIQTFMEPSCTWAGLSTTGMQLTNGHLRGYVWLAGAAWNITQAYLHELGHNFGLQHAATPGPSGCSTCDTTSAMGYYGPGPAYCYNAPENWGLGWQQDAAPALSYTTMPAGQQLEYQLPGQAFSRNSLLRVTSGAANNNTIFLSFRSNQGLYDVPFAPNRNAPTLLIHSWDDSVRQDYISANTTFLQASLAATVTAYLPLTWTEPATGLTVTLRSADPLGASATVAVCKPAERGRELSCFNGLDDDCDGLPDAQDPDCFGAVAPAPMVTPVPRPNPSPRPTPRPDPAPAPQPIPVPAPQPVPVPAPQPVPVPSPGDSQDQSQGSPATADAAVAPPAGAPPAPQEQVNQYLELLRQVLAGLVIPAPQTQSPAQGR